MSKVISKVKDMLGFGEFDEELDDYELEERVEEQQDDNDDIEPVITNRKSQANKVLNIHTNSTARVTVTRPNDYEDATEICDALKNRRIVVVNTTSMDNKIAQRLLDFISGSCYALSGELSQIERGVYILSPSNVEVTNELKNELSSKAMFSFTK
ncbi:MAG: cell division protein SepF [Clostridium sp.]